MIISVVTSSIHRLTVALYVYYKCTLIFVSIMYFKLLGIIEISI
ncbi:MAG: hypothetical protein PF517_10830 [Salinivirgaceae bacterium]|nr:hypothetical protein [Salinivirgaceae bacterium]